MSLPTLTPASNTSVSVLPATGTHSSVNSADNPLPYGVYIAKAATDAVANTFISGAVDQVAYVYKKLGGDIIDIEISEHQVYTAYEEAVLEYSYIVNVHQAKNSLSDMLGNATGSFDEDGTILEGEVLSGSSVELALPKFKFEYSKRASDGITEEAGFGGTRTVYSASFDKIDHTQDYDLQNIISGSSHLSSSYDYYQKVGNNRVTIRRVFYKTPQAMWRFYGYYGGLNTVGNLSNYGQYADDSTFEVVPAWQNKSQALAFEDSLYTRLSHFSYELKGNNLRIFPAPVESSPTKFWVEFTVEENAWEEAADMRDGARGINNMNTLPFDNIAYDKINSIGKQWIRRFSLALCKEMLGQVRSKFATVPIPGESVTLNGPALVSEGKEEQVALREELKTTLDELTYQRLTERDAAIATSTTTVQQSVPVPVFVG
jgi:hypothetical protein